MNLYGGEKMLYYLIEAAMTNMKEIENHTDRYNYAYERRIKCDELYAKSGKRAFIFISNMRNTKITVGCIEREEGCLEKYLPTFWRANEIEVENQSIKEITLDALDNVLRLASRNSYIDDNNEILNKFKLNDIIENSGLHISEDIFEGERT